MAVVGAGLLGTTTALLLSRRGLAVDLIDANQRIWQGATATGEGKIHLGYVYGLADADTIAPIVRGALAFDDVVTEALGRRLDWPALSSGRFSYVVHPESLSSCDELSAHYERVHDVLADECGKARDRVMYLGTPVEDLRVPSAHRGRVGGLWRFDTDERSVDVVRLFSRYEQALVEATSVRRRLGAKVVEAARSYGAWWLGIHNDGCHANLGPYEAVVNAAWDQQARLTQVALGRADSTPHNFRLRAFLGGRTRKTVPAVTIVQGPFGDMVGFRGGRIYASWYPVGLLGFSTGIHPPEHWSDIAQEVEGDTDIAKRMLKKIEALLEIEVEVKDLHVRARVVLARGDTDISNRDSPLHQRDAPTVTEIDGWVVPSSPKLTTAPITALETCAVVEGIVR